MGGLSRVGLKRLKTHFFRFFTDSGLCGLKWRLSTPRKGPRPLIYKTLPTSAISPKKLMGRCGGHASIVARAGPSWL